MTTVLSILLLAVLSLSLPLGLSDLPPCPSENPLTVESVELGRKLFFERKLSRDNTVSCASCHNPAMAFTDQFDRARGIQHRVGPRRTPRILNRAWGRSFFWDGRVPSLEDQVSQPISNPLEMGSSMPEVIAKLRGLPPYRGITEEKLRNALASYVRTILSGDSPYDRFQAGNRSALTDEQQRGLDLFRGRAGCASCHHGPNFTDEEFHCTGAGGSDDPGRAFVTSNAEDLGFFKTPGLRHVAQTPPYFHDGSARTLADVIEYYNQGGKDGLALDPGLKPLGLTPQEKQDLIAFLHALSGTIREGVQ